MNQMAEYNDIASRVDIRLERIRNDMREHHRRHLERQDDEVLVTDLRVLLEALDKGILAINRKGA